MSDFVCLHVSDLKITLFDKLLDMWKNNEDENKILAMIASYSVMVETLQEYANKE